MANDRQGQPGQEDEWKYCGVAGNGGRMKIRGVAGTGGDREPQSWNRKGITYPVCER